MAPPEGPCQLSFIDSFPFRCCCECWYQHKGCCCTCSSLAYRSHWCACTDFWLQNRSLAICLCLYQADVRLYSVVLQLLWVTGCSGDLKPQTDMILGRNLPMPYTADTHLIRYTCLANVVCCTSTAHATLVAPHHRCWVRIARQDVLDGINNNILAGGWGQRGWAADAGLRFEEASGGHAN